MTEAPEWDINGRLNKKTNPTNKGTQFSLNESSVKCILLLANAERRLIWMKNVKTEIFLGGFHIL